MKTIIEYMGVGLVTKDMEPGSLYIEISPVEQIPSVDGDLGKNDTVSTTGKDMSGKNVVVKADKTGAITARWLPEDNSNVITAPCVNAGETVNIYDVGGTGEYGWRTLGTDMDIRKRDRYILFIPSKPSKDKNWLDKGYYFMVDSVGKSVSLHTSNDDGEATTYDLVLNTKDGVISINDGLANTITLTSLKGSLHIKTNNRIDLEAPKFTVKNTVCELVQTISDLIGVLMSEVHIDSRKGETSVSTGTVSALGKLKSKISSFLG